MNVGIRRIVRMFASGINVKLDAKPWTFREIQMPICRINVGRPCNEISSPCFVEWIKMFLDQKFGMLQVETYSCRDGPPLMRAIQLPWANARFATDKVVGDTTRLMVQAERCLPPPAARV